MTYSVNISRSGLNAVIELQGGKKAISRWLKNDLPPLPDKPNSASEHDGLMLYWVSAERWLLRSVIDNEDRMLEITRLDSAPAEISIVLVSDTLCFFEISGADADDIISIACPMDLHLDAFAQNGVSYTYIFGIKGLLIRSGKNYEIAIESSHADMIDDYFSRALS